MTDPKLIEAVARAIGRSVMQSRVGGKQTITDREFDWEWDIPQWRKACEDAAEAALSAIDASGEWWVAPWDSGMALDAANLDYGEYGEFIDAWPFVRTAYLAKPEKTV